MFNKFLIKIKNLVLIALLFYSSAIDCMQQGFTQEQLQSQEEANQEQSTNDNESENDGNDNSGDESLKVRGASLYFIGFYSCPQWITYYFDCS